MFSFLMVAMTIETTKTVKAHAAAVVPILVYHRCAAAAASVHCLSCVRGAIDGRTGARCAKRGVPANMAGLGLPELVFRRSSVKPALFEATEPVFMAPGRSGS